MVTASIRRLGVLAACALLLAACSDDCGCVLPPDYSALPQWIREAATVVVADVVDAGSHGDVSIRPTTWLRGSLPVDADGVYRFKWRTVDNPVSGLWLFDAKGRPISKDDERHYFDYPWGVDEMVIDQFIRETEAEAARVLGEADLVVELQTARYPHIHTVKEQRFSVQQVLRGARGVAVGDLLYVTSPSEYANAGDTVDPGDHSYWSSIWALRWVDGVWQTVPSWLPQLWPCNAIETDAVLASFPTYHATDCPERP